MIHQFNNITSYYKRERIICSQNFILAQFFHCFNRKKKILPLRNIRIIYKSKRVKSRSGENLRKNIGWWRDTANELLFFFSSILFKSRACGTAKRKSIHERRRTVQVAMENGQLHVPRRRELALAQV